MKVSNEKSPARYCDSFFIKSYLANHITAVYEGNEPFQCKICDYKCDLMPNLGAFWTKTKFFMRI